MNKKKLIIIIASILVVATISVGVGLGIDNYIFQKDSCNDRISLNINWKFKDKFLAEEFTPEDFGWDNIESIKYGPWFYKGEESGAMTVYLKKPGKWRVKRAIKHLEKLDFVNSASIMGHYYAG